MATSEETKHETPKHTEHHLPKTVENLKPKAKAKPLPSDDEILAFLTRVKTRVQSNEEVKDEEFEFINTDKVEVYLNDFGCIVCEFDDPFGTGEPPSRTLLTVCDIVIALQTPGKAVLKNQCESDPTHHVQGGNGTLTRDERRKEQDRIMAEQVQMHETLSRENKDKPGFDPSETTQRDGYERGMPKAMPVKTQEESKNAEKAPQRKGTKENKTSE